MANEKRATLRGVGEAETWFHHQSILGNEGISNLELLPEAAHIRHPNFGGLDLLEASQIPGCENQ